MDDHAQHWRRTWCWIDGEGPEWRSQTRGDRSAMARCTLPGFLSPRLSARNSFQAAVLRYEHLMYLVPEDEGTRISMIFGVAEEPVASRSAACSRHCVHRSCRSGQHSFSQFQVRVSLRGSICVLPPGLRSQANHEGALSSAALARAASRGCQLAQHSASSGMRRVGPASAPKNPSMPRRAKVSWKRIDARPYEKPWF